MKCERKIGQAAVCGRPPVAFVMGQHVCALHDPQGDPNCTHALLTTDRCPFCGAKVPS